MPSRDGKGSAGAPRTVKIWSRVAPVFLYGVQGKGDYVVMAKMPFCKIIILQKVGMIQSAELPYIRWQLQDIAVPCRALDLGS